ncbi:MAG: glucokinase [Desulfobulbaceae bacterium]|nr:glucokinase [Desulfobulbaceae bacterium]
MKTNLAATREIVSATNASLLLAGDIGGTKTNLAIFAEGDPLRPIAESSFPSADYDALETLISEFLSTSSLSVDRAAFGVAGPVIEGRAQITKLPWLIDSKSIETTFDLSKVVLVNDLVATAYGIGILPDSDLICLNQGKPVKHGPLAVIAPGTGLGEAMMFWDGHCYQPQATEGGHALFSPANSQHLALATFLFERGGPVTFDLLASGRGLPLIYDFLKESSHHDEPHWLAKAMSEGDPAPVISHAALDATSSDPLCLATVRLFVEILAVEAANLALKSLSTGGLFIGGGIPPRIVSIFHDVFVSAFVGQHSLRDLLAAMPIHLINNPKTALLGAASLAMKPL